VQRLLRGAALTVDRGARHALRQLRGHDRVARDVVGLLTDLHHAAHDHVLDQSGIDPGAIDQLVQHLGGEIGRMPAGEAAPLAPARGPRGGDDISLGHFGLSHGCYELGWSSGADLMGGISFSQSIN